MLRALPDIPFQLLLDALVGGVDLAYDPADLEALVVAEADAAPGRWHVAHGRDTATRAVVAEPLAGGAEGWAWAWTGRPPMRW